MKEEIKPNHYKLTIKGIEFDFFELGSAMDLSREQFTALRYFRKKGDIEKQINDTEKAIECLKRHADNLRNNVDEITAQAKKDTIDAINEWLKNSQIKEIERLTNENENQKKCIIKLNSELCQFSEKYGKALSDCVSLSVENNRLRKQISEYITKIVEK